MGTVKIDAVSNRLGHGNTIFQGMFFQPLHLLRVDLDLSSYHFFGLATDTHGQTQTFIRATRPNKDCHRFANNKIQNIFIRYQKLQFNYY
jgi:hypothetical protein